MGRTVVVWVLLGALATAVVATVVGWGINQLPALDARVSARKRIWLAVALTVVAALTAAGVSLASSDGSATSAGTPRTAAASGSGTPSTSAPAPSPAPSDPATATTTSSATGDGTAAVTYLYRLPGNSAGQPGPQRGPADVRLGGQRYARSTGMWTQCGGEAVPKVSFFTGHKYQRLVGTLGIADSAPAGLSVQVQVYGDDGVWQWFTVRHGESLPVDLEIGRFGTVALTATSAGDCPDTSKPFVYIGDGGVV
ncbi:hypothetical protein [Nucisporomicrobium flavum]|uniref:hypothetical protein n=1 Tax=Nucisporomicrobium flavum TaxID=2785915 RepID=UPI0018F78663|nr:hypothetical protein [Nucisporomicrobium flavum]